MSYEHYANMTSDQTDKMCDGENLQIQINQFHQQQQSRTTLKSMATSEGEDLVETKKMNRQMGNGKVLALTNKDEELIVN
jgi:hypothetical protein